MLRRLRRIAALSAAGTLMATGLVALSATSADAGTPKETGCPSGALLLSVTDLIDQGYDPDFWHAIDANADGFACGHPVSAPVQNRICGGPCPVPIIYRAGDNTLTQEH